MTHTVKCQNPACSKVFTPSAGSLGKYCSLSCGTSHRNKLKKQAMLNEYSASPTLCKYCNSPLNYENRHQLFCSHSCNAKYQNPLRPKKVKIPYDSNAVLLERFNNGLISQRATLRKAISLVKGYCCDICKLSNWNNENITLVVDHIDGNAGNNTPDNLRLLCPNCNSQTPTFGGRNKGNGRKARGLPLS